MATWGDYQSVIQLAAGLNFAYASLEVILERPLLVLSSRQKALIDRLRQVAQTKSKSPQAVDAVLYCQMRDHLDDVTACHTVICNLNPYISAMSGFAATALLFYASHHANAPASFTDVIFISAIGYGWFCVTLLAMAVLRLFLLLRVEPKLTQLGA